MAGGRSSYEHLDAGPGAGKHGKFTDECWLPEVLLVERSFSGPWTIEKVDRKRNSIRVVHAPTGTVAWEGPGTHHYHAERLCERANAWEIAREFPPGKRYSWLAEVKPLSDPSTPRPVYPPAPPLGEPLPIPGTTVVERESFLKEKERPFVPQLPEGIRSFVAKRKKSDAEVQ